MRPPRKERPPRPSSDQYHDPVLLDQIIAYLQPHDGGVYVDGTLGGGGHAEAILRASSPGGILIGIDRDPEALEAARARLAEFGERLRTAHGTFDRIAEFARAEGFDAVDGVLFDLGVSSRQLDRAERGFSFRQDAPLDMRMDPTSEPDATEVVNTLPERELERIIRELGEERFAGRIAHAIRLARERGVIDTTGRLAQIISDAVPAGYRHGRIHPATRTFQGLRIFVNQELELLERALEETVSLLRPGGRVAVISYHSLEDRIVKTTFRRLAGKGQPADESAPPVLHLTTPKPVVPERAEILRNPRARSAKLRVAERIAPDA